MELDSAMRSTFRSFSQTVGRSSKMWPTERGGVLCVSPPTQGVGVLGTRHADSHRCSGTGKRCRVSRGHIAGSQREKGFKHHSPRFIVNFAILYFLLSSISSLSSHLFRVKLMRSKTVLRQLHSLARLSFPPATLPQRKSRLISRAWPARERRCWPPGRRSRQSLSSAWNYSCF